MPNLIVIRGQNGYEDCNANLQLIRYILNSPFQIGYKVKNAMCFGGNCEALAAQFAFVQGLRPDRGIHLHHMVLGLDDIDEVSDREYLKIMDIAVDYFAQMGVQVIAAYHYRSRESAWHPHIHILLNHVSIEGNVFWANNTEYGKFLKVLRIETKMNWQYVYHKMNL